MLWILMLACWPDVEMDQAVKQGLEDTSRGGEVTDDTLYPGHLRLDLDGPDADEFWFREDVHHPGPIFPFETIIPEAIKLAMGQINTRMLAFPMSNGIDVRVHQGRIYFSRLCRKFCGSVRTAS